jgi:hypothetical protein
MLRPPAEKKKEMVKRLLGMQRNLRIKRERERERKRKKREREREREIVLISLSHSIQTFFF